MANDAPAGVLVVSSGEGGVAADDGAEGPSHSAASPCRSPHCWLLGCSIGFGFGFGVSEGGGNELWMMVGTGSVESSCRSAASADCRRAE